MTQNNKQAYARGSGYKWLAQQMGMTPEQCHIGLMDVEECRRVVDICINWRERRVA